ncbi:tryptophan-rich sensory protein [Leifsonia sp. A12D58]|uniref:tryptophan-rich sensory protein n=1 Tax=Leifsonia sp. A12D58 TaxID=3397674 RepID=UPI0039DFF4E0
MTATPQTADRVRQITVFILSLLAIAGATFGSGAFGGTPIQDAAGGALSADATLIAPAGPAFGIWSVIYLGLFAYAVWQLFPSQGARTVHRRVGYLIALSMLLNAAWIGSVQLGRVGLSVLVIVVLLFILGFTFALLQRTPRDVDTTAARVTEAVVLDGTIGLYLGWVTIATAANVAAWLTDLGFTGWGINPDVWGVIVVAVAAVVGVATAIAGRGRLTPAISLSWGLAWLAVARLSGEPESQAVGISAALAAVVVLAAAVIARVVAQRSGYRPADNAYTRASVPDQA